MQADDLISRLSETLDELERVATEATPGQWIFEDSSEDLDGAIYARDGEDWGAEVAYARSGGATSPVDLVHRQDANGRHIARWDPEAALGLVAAVRGVIAKHPPYRCADSDETRVGQRCDTCASDEAYSNGVAVMAPWPCPTLVDLCAGFGITEEDSNGG